MTTAHPPTPERHVKAEPARCGWVGGRGAADASASPGVIEVRASLRPVTSEGRSSCGSRSSQTTDPLASLPRRLPQTLGRTCPSFVGKRPRLSQTHRTLNQTPKSFVREHPTFVGMHPSLFQTHRTLNQTPKSFVRKPPTFIRMHPTFVGKRPRLSRAPMEQHRARGDPCAGLVPSARRVHADRRGSG